jgi:hypothetical protein
MEILWDQLLSNYEIQKKTWKQIIESACREGGDALPGTK